MLLIANVKNSDAADVLNSNGHEAIMLNWTTEPPTVEGWYWVNVVIARMHSTIFIVHYPYQSDENIDKITNWLGPLPMPLRPQE